MNDRDIVREICRITGAENTSDDCAHISAGGANLCVTTDMLHESTDFPKGMTYRQMGWMSAAVTLSDLASTGSVPVSLVIALGLTEESAPHAAEIVQGAKDCCSEFGAELSGGDTDSHDELTIVTTGIGFAGTGGVKRRSPRPLSPDDLVCVCGALGKAQAGLNDYFSGRTDTENFRALCEPHPLVREGIMLKEAGVDAMMDISDGLLISLYDLAEVNGCGFEINKSSIPADESSGIDFETAFTGGGDFGLLYICRREIFESGALPGFVIGHPVMEKGVFVDGVMVGKKGYEHEWGN